MTKPSWGPDLDVSPEQARDLIALQFPHIAPRSVERFGAGMDNLAYLVDEKYVFRFPRRAIAVPLLETEAAILPLIAPHLPVPIPAARFVGTPRGPYPWMFAGYELLTGTIACSIVLSEDARRMLARPLGSFLRALHSIDPAQAIARGLPGDTIGRLDHNKRMPLAVERFAQLEAAGRLEDAQPFLKFMIEHAPHDVQPSAIVHGDLYARHILLDDSASISGVIDWGDVHFGHPANDLMAAHTMLPNDAHAEFIDAYGGIDEATWLLAKYRAIYHSALVAHYGMNIEDAALVNAGISGLKRICPESRITM